MTKSSDTLAVPTDPGTPAASSGADAGLEQGIDTADPPQVEAPEPEREPENQEPTTTEVSVDGVTNGDDGDQTRRLEHRPPDEKEKPGDKGTRTAAPERAGAEVDNGGGQVGAAEPGEPEPGTGGEPSATSSEIGPEPVISERRDGYDVFLSYSREDAERARWFVSAFESHGWAVFWDIFNIPPGVTFHDFIRQSLSESRCVVVLWSRNSVRSKWVDIEAREADERGVLVPVLLDELGPSEIPFGLHLVHATPLHDWDGGAQHANLDLLCQTIRAKLGTAR